MAKENKTNKTNLETTHVYHYGSIWTNCGTFILWNAIYKGKNELEFKSTNVERCPKDIK